MSGGEAKEVYYQIEVCNPSEKVIICNPSEKVIMTGFSVVVPIVIVWCCTLLVCYIGKICSSHRGGASAARPAAAAMTGLPAIEARFRLKPEVLSALPVFMYSSDDGSGKEKLECAVCLMEFKDGERGRILPRCGHKFHLECIDMWFCSHSNCPLCRSAVEPETDGDLPV